MEINRLLALIGGWNESYTGDRQVLCKIFGCQAYDEVRQKLEPFFKSDSVFQYGTSISSKIELESLGAFTQSDIDFLNLIAIEIAESIGLMSSEEINEYFSEELLLGIARSLFYLGTRRKEDIEHLEIPLELKQLIAVFLFKLVSFIEEDFDETVIN